jgi:hypothetical protein
MTLSFEGSRGHVIETPKGKLQHLKMNKGSMGDCKRIQGRVKGRIEASIKGPGRYVSLVRGLFCMEKRLRPKQLSYQSVSCCDLYTV